MTTQEMENGYDASLMGDTEKRKPVNSRFAEMIGKVMALIISTCAAAIIIALTAKCIAWIL